MWFVRFLVAASLAALAGCTDPCSQPVPFTKVSSDVFQVSCKFSSCHPVDSPMNNLVLGDTSTPPPDELTEIYNGLVNATPYNKAAKVYGWKRIVPGDLGHSYLFEKVTQAVRTDPLLGDRMPQAADDEYISDAQLTTLQCWIQQGAKND